MGPIWDFDISMGNYFEEGGTADANNPERFRVMYVEWYRRMFTDPEFVACVKRRFNEYYNSQELIYGQIDKIEAETHEAYPGDIYRWRPSYSDSPHTYRMERINYLKGWLKKRFDWLKTEFDKM